MTRTREADADRALDACRIDSSVERLVDAADLRAVSVPPRLQRLGHCVQLGLQRRMDVIHPRRDTHKGMTFIGQQLRRSSPRLASGLGVVRSDRSIPSGVCGIAS
jgi:hypothetical protein